VAHLALSLACAALVIVLAVATFRTALDACALAFKR
jgi:hypothetical protein